MKVVIDIDELSYHRFAAGFANEDDAGLIEYLFKNGVPLPKGHGRLVDENYIIAELVYRRHLLADDVKCGEVTKIFDNAVVIEADR